MQRIRTIIYKKIYHIQIKTKHKQKTKHKNIKTAQNINTTINVKQNINITCEPCCALIYFLNMIRRRPNWANKF